MRAMCKIEGMVGEQQELKVTAFQAAKAIKVRIHAVHICSSKGARPIIRSENTNYKKRRYHLLHGYHG
jgi:intein-encoded DNA endonuclease-like protein